MKTYTDKRAFERHRHTATMEFSYFNRDHYYEAQTFNHSDEGMCFKSEISLRPGAAVLIRIKDLYPNGACNGDCRGLRSLALAEAKWCKEISNETKSFYEVGAKYYPPEY